LQGKIAQTVSWLVVCTIGYVISTLKCGSGEEC